MTHVTNFDVTSFDVERFDEILARGLSHGVGHRDGQMCIEAAICCVLDLPHDDDPGCVASAVRSFKIALNDKQWTSPQARAAGLRDLGLAQLGSKGVVDDKEFAMKLAAKVISRLLPEFIRDVFPKDEVLLAAALCCEQEGTREAALNLKADAYDAYAAYAAANAAAAARKPRTDKYLILAAKLALEALRELKSPGVQLLGDA